MQVGAFDRGHESITDAGVRKLLRSRDESFAVSLRQPGATGDPWSLDAVEAHQMLALWLDNRQIAKRARPAW